MENSKDDYVIISRNTYNKYIRFNVNAEDSNSLNCHLPVRFVEQLAHILPRR